MVGNTPDKFYIEAIQNSMLQPISIQLLQARYKWERFIGPDIYLSNAMKRTIRYGLEGEESCDFVFRLLHLHKSGRIRHRRSHQQSVLLLNPCRFRSCPLFTPPHHLYFAPLHYLYAQNLKPSLFIRWCHLPNALPPNLVPLVCQNYFFLSIVTPIFNKLCFFLMGKERVKETTIQLRRPNRWPRFV